MNTTKNILFFCFLVSYTLLRAQDKNIQESFSKSYEYESNYNYEAAISSLLKVYDAQSYEMNLRLGWLYYSAGKHKESIIYYKKAKSIMPAATEPLWALVNPYTAAEQWNDLESIYLSILKLDPKNNLAHYRLGLIYYYRKNYVAAKKHFDIALNLYPFDYNNMLMSAWTNYFLGNKNEALILFKKVLLYSPQDSSAKEGLSLIK